MYNKRKNLLKEFIPNYTVLNFEAFNSSQNPSAVAMKGCKFAEHGTPFLYPLVASYLSAIWQIIEKPRVILGGTVGNRCGRLANIEITSTQMESIIKIVSCLKSEILSYIATIIFDACIKYLRLRICNNNLLLYIVNFISIT